VDSVASGGDALSAIREHDGDGPYDVVFMDWRMPGMDGLEATSRLREDTRLHHRPRVVMVTAFGRDEVRDEAERLKVDAFLLKPVTKSMLVDTLVSLFAPSSQEITSVSESLETQIRLDGVRILLVEDNEINQQIATELLEGAGAQVRVAANGRLAVEALEQASEPFQIVLMDLQMPEMDGHQATTKIRAQARWKDLPIIAMTAHATQEERQRCLEIGMNDHVTKPIEPAILFTTLAKYVQPPPPRIDLGLPEISGLDTADGLMRLGGNQALYLKLLRQFFEGERSAAREILALLNANDPGTAERRAHTIKGVAGNLGAKQVQEAAGKLEKAIATNVERTQLESHCLDLQRALAGVFEPLSAALGSKAPGLTPAAPSAPRGPVELSRAAEVLSQLRKQLTEFDAVAADSVEANKEILRALLPPDAFVALEKAVQGYAFDDALAQLDRAPPLRADAN
jgi:two-component system sensor histidine kinase/response regulator